MSLLKANNQIKSVFDFAALEHCVEQIQEAQTSQDAFDSFCEAIAVFEFSFASMGRLLPSLSGDQSTKNVPRQFHLSRGAEGWIKEIVETGTLITKSPLVLYGFRVSVPFRWREAYASLSEDQQEHVKKSRSNGLKYGICFPMLQVRTAPGLMSLGRDKDFELSLRDLVVLEMFVRVVFDRVYDLTEMPKKKKWVTITDREREVLTLVARGKTNWEIGTIMTISEYSVRDYLKQLSKRLGTANRTHTVTKAIRLGLILP